MSIERELTGNDYISVPFLYGDCGMDGVNVLHGRLAGLVEWSGDGADAPLFRPAFRVAGREAPLREARWRRLDRWIPTCAADLGDSVAVTVTVCAPGGYPAARGMLLRFDLENRGRAPVEVDVELAIDWRWSRLWIASGRPLAGDNRMVESDGAVVLETDAGRGPALAVLPGGPAGILPADTGGNGDAVVAFPRSVPNGQPLRARLAQRVTLVPNRRTPVSVFVGAGRERDGALAAAAGLRRAGADTLLRQARMDLSHTLRAGQDHRWGDMLNRNLIFNRYFAAGRGIDDDRLYLLRSRSTACPGAALFNEREALLWTLPALTLADPGIAREALFRVLEVFSERAGEYLRYIDGGAYDPAFCLDQYLLYPWAVEQYSVGADDPSVLDEPLLRQVLIEADNSLFMRLHPEHMLASTELLPSGDSADHPYTTYSNVLLWWFSESLNRLWQHNGDEQPPRFQGAASEVAAAIWQHCVTDLAGEPVFASSTNLQGDAAVYDDPLGSLALMPFFGFCPHDDPVWGATMEFLRSSRYPLWRAGAVGGLAGRARPAAPRLAALCADLLGPAAPVVLDTLLRVQLPGGLAAAAFDPETGAASEPDHAALAGFLAWTLLRAAEPARPGRDARRRR